MVELLCGSQQTASTCVVWSWRLIERFALTSAVTGFETRVIPVTYPNGFATLVVPNKGETAVCGYHCPRDMAVRMREVLAQPWVGVCVLLALSLHYFH